MNTNLNNSHLPAKALTLVAIWAPTIWGPPEVFGITVHGVSLFITFIFLFLWSLTGSKMAAFREELRMLVRHREDGGLTSVTAAMFLVGAQMYVTTQIVWIISVILQFNIDPNWYQFSERAGYILMGGRPLQMGVQYAATKVKDQYRGPRRRRRDDDDEDDRGSSRVYTPSPSEGDEMLRFESPEPIQAQEPKVTPTTPQEMFVAKAWQHAKAAMSTTGIKHIFTIAQGACESRWGQSGIGTDKNNIFGITATDSYSGRKVLKTTTEYHKDQTGKYPKVHSITWDDKRGMYKYRVDRYFRDYDTLEQAFIDHSRILQAAHFSHAWPFRGDARKFAEKIQAGKLKYATSPMYTKTLHAFIAQVEKIAEKLNLR